MSASELKPEQYEQLRMMILQVAADCSRHGIFPHDYARWLAEEQYPKIEDATGRVVADEPEWVAKVWELLESIRATSNTKAKHRLVDKALALLPAPREAEEAADAEADAEADDITTRPERMRKAKESIDRAMRDEFAQPPLNGEKSDDTAEYSQLETKPDATGMFVNAQGDHIPLDRPVADWLRWYFAWKGDTTTRLEQLEHLRLNMIGARVHGQLIRQIDDILDAEHAAPEGD